MPDVSYLVETISGVPVVTAPAEIDLTTADQLRLVLLEAAAHGYTTVVVDMTRTRFCDSAGLSVLARAHKRALEEGGELRLVMPAGGAVFRIFTLTRLHRFIPRFDRLQEALLPRPATALIRPSRPRPFPGLAHGDGEGAVLSGRLTASVTAGESGPVLMLSGEADLSSAGLLRGLITAQVCRGTRQLTVDVSGLRFADSATIRTLVLAARTLRERGGTLVLLHPQPAVARSLAVTGAEQMFTIRGETPGEPESGCG